MSDRFDLTLTMVAITCCKEGCGITFGVPNWWNTKRREDHTSFWCPNGHSQHFYAKSEAEQLREQLERANSMLSFRGNVITRLENEKETLERSNRAVRGHAKRIKARAAAGVCPAGCKRHFANLQRHIQSKHPRWKSDDHEA